MNNQESGPAPKSAEKATATGVNSGSDPEKSPGGKRPSAVVNMSQRVGGLSIRAKSEAKKKAEEEAATNAKADAEAKAAAEAEAAAKAAAQAEAKKKAKEEAVAKAKAVAIAEAKKMKNAAAKAKEEAEAKTAAEAEATKKAEEEADKTILGETANLLGGDLFETMLAFLPVDQLMFVRSLSKDIKMKVDEMVSKRAPQQPLTLDLEWLYDEEENRSMVHQGWTEALQDRESVIYFAIQTSNLSANCQPWVIEVVTESLRRNGSADLDKLKQLTPKLGRNIYRNYDSDSSGRYRCRCWVEWNDVVEVSKALQQVAKYFQRLERGVKCASVFHSLQELDVAEETAFSLLRTNGLRKIAVAKEFALSLILTNSSNTVSFSKVKMENYYGEDSDGNGYSTVLVFRLENDMEIYLNSSSDDISDQYYNFCRWVQNREANNIQVSEN